MRYMRSSQEDVAGRPRTRRRASLFTLRRCVFAVGMREHLARELALASGLFREGAASLRPPYEPERRRGAFPMASGGETRTRSATGHGAASAVALVAAGRSAGFQPAPQCLLPLAPVIHPWRLRQIPFRCGALTARWQAGALGASRLSSQSKSLRDHAGSAEALAWRKTRLRGRFSRPCQDGSPRSRSFSAFPRIA